MGVLTVDAEGLLPFGRRYAGKMDPASRDLIAELPFCSYKRAIAVYDELVGDGLIANDTLAYLACNDRFFLLTYLLGRQDAFHPWLYSRSRQVEHQPDDHLDLWARYHYKSTIVTFAGIIQEVLRDPEITVVIFSVTAKIATKFLKQIKEEFERNELLKEVFADVLFALPKKEATNWADTGITVRRLSNPKEGTVEAYGLLDGIPTGGHYRLRVYDDVINEKVVTETKADLIAKITTQWQLSQNLGTAEGGRQWHVGTRYHFADTYGQLMGRGILLPRLFPATNNGRPDGKPVFLTPDAWEKVKVRQWKTLAAQMLQNPMATNENTFEAIHLRPYQLRPRTLNVYILGDPSKGTGKRSDRTAIIVLGLDSNGNYYLLDGMLHRMRQSERWDNLRMLYKKWMKEPGVQHVRVGWERYGMQTDLEFFEEKMVNENFGMDIVEVNWTREGDQSKDDRIERLEPYLRDSRFWLPPKIWQPGQGVCLWSISPDTHQVVLRPLVNEDTEYVAGEIRANTAIGSRQKEEMIAKLSVTKADREAIKANAEYRVMRPIRYLNEEGEIYDLAWELIQEIIMHPFSPWKDGIDAVSRVFDVEPVPPQLHIDVPQPLAIT